MCSENPLAAIFGASKAKELPAKKRTPSISSSKVKESKRNPAKFEQRSPEECQALVKEWQRYAHPRAREFFVQEGALEEVLLKLAQSTSKGDDLILGDENKCVFWFGDVTEEGQAAIRMVKPGEPQESITYVNRVLAFVFATDDSFDALMKLPKEPFKMNCCDQLCVNLAHISTAV